ncbi:uncharacterized protein [Periplaneta americana]|uniref:uncharacterized protein isoform X6 n=1 Tax=Periplaneta americana TaxID=6978 RepID=UPI0037E8611C
MSVQICVENQEMLCEFAGLDLEPETLFLILVWSLQLKIYASTLPVLMDMIKTEPDVDPLAIHMNDDTEHLTWIKVECVDPQYDLTSEVKLEQASAPAVKCETKEESCDADALKEELKVEVTAEDDEVLTKRNAVLRISTIIPQ